MSSPAELRETNRLTIDGAQGSAQARALRDAAVAAAAGVGQVTVDCRTAEHLHATVIQVLLSLERELAKSGRQLILTNVSAGVRRFLEVAGVSKQLQAEASS